MNFFHHKDLGNHLLQLCPKVVKHPVYRVQNVFLHCPTPRLYCFLSSHWPSVRFLSFMAFFIPSIQFFFGLPRAHFYFGIHFNAILGSLSCSILYKIKYYIISVYFSSVNYKNNKWTGISSSSSSSSSNNSISTSSSSSNPQVLLDKRSAIVHTADNTYVWSATSDVYKNTHAFPFTWHCCVT